MTENDLFDILRQAIASGRVSVQLDFRRLKHVDSPIFVEAEANRWIYGIMAGTLGAGIGLTLPAGGVVLAGGVGLYWLVGRPWVHRRMAARFHDKVLVDITVFKKLWRLNGVSLTLASRAEVCRSPKGEWRRFVLRNLARAAPGPDERGPGADVDP